MSTESAPQLVERLRLTREDDALRNSLEIQRWLKVLEVLLPAALNSAANGNVTMRQAVIEINHLLPK